MISGFHLPAVFFIFISFGISMELGESSTVPERAVPRKAKHVDVIADKHDVTNLFSDIVNLDIC